MGEMVEERWEKSRKGEIKDEREGWRRKEGERMKGRDGGRKGRRKDERVGWWQEGKEKG